MDVYLNLFRCCPRAIGRWALIMAAMTLMLVQAGCEKCPKTADGQALGVLEALYCIPDGASDDIRVEGGERCPDNFAPGDQCGTTGSSEFARPLTCATTGLCSCGNGRVDIGEECDGSENCDNACRIICSSDEDCGSLGPNQGFCREDFSCNSATKRCEGGKALPAGTECGNGGQCDSSANCITCELEGTECFGHGNVCALGILICTDREANIAKCASAGPKPANTVCGDKKVCDGQSNCLGCEADEGKACVPENPCKAGSIVCTEGDASCEEGANLPNGTLCRVNGDNGACFAPSPDEDSQCVTCEVLAASNTVCPTPMGGGCGVGTLACDASGKPVCVPGSTPRTEGECVRPGATTPGTCNEQGTCVGCDPANPTAECPPLECVEEVSLPGGQTGYTVAPSGTACTGGVCNAIGECVPCANAAGGDCVPQGDDECMVGALACAADATSCDATDVPRAEGYPCSNNGYCDGKGQCVSCADGGEACEPSNQCLNGVNGCYRDQRGVCVIDSAKPRGADCDPGDFCDGEGTCVDCGDQLHCPGALQCIDPNTDINHCGGCDNDCASQLQNVVGIKCENGTCDYERCEDGWSDCDGNRSNGCETSVNDVNHCGGCDIKCADQFPGSTPNCVNGQCQFSGQCNPPLADCNSQAGCETQLGTNANCAGCGDNCRSRGLTCVNGSCQASCSDGIKNGNETDVDCGGSCGRCQTGQRCGGAGDCVGNICVSGICRQAGNCSPGQTIPPQNQSCTIPGCATPNTGNQSRTASCQLQGNVYNFQWSAWSGCGGTCPPVSQCVTHTITVPNVQNQDALNLWRSMGSANFCESRFGGGFRPVERTCEPSLGMYNLGSMGCLASSQNPNLPDPAWNRVVCSNNCGAGSKEMCVTPPANAVCYPGMRPVPNSFRTTSQCGVIRLSGPTAGAANTITCTR